MKKTLVLLFACLCFGTMGCSKEPSTINISAAASLTDALLEIKEEYSKENSDTLEFNFAGSGTLQKQIEEGAPCDLFFSAAKSNTDKLISQDLIDTQYCDDILKNKLVLISGNIVLSSVNEITNENIKSIAIGNTETVPAGTYAKEALESLKIYDEVQNKLIFAKDVKLVAQYVESGNVDCGFVYNSDCVIMETNKIDVPEDLYSQILYPLALVKDSKNKEVAIKFYNFIKSDTCKKIFEKYGFTVL